MRGLGAGKYRKRPIEVDVMQIDDGQVPRHDNLGTAAEVAAWCGGEAVGDSVLVPTGHGELPAHPGDWVIRGIWDFYPFPKAEFGQAFDPIDPVVAGITRLTREAAGNDLPIV